METNTNTMYGKLTDLSRALPVLIVLLIAQVTAAQEKNEISAYVKGTMSRLSFDGLDRSSDMGTGIGFGIGYGYSVSDRLSIVSGVEYLQVTGNADVGEIGDAVESTDAEGENFVFRYRFSYYRENIKADLISIPLKVQYETEGKTRFYAAGGLKMGLVLNADTESKAASLSTSGFYEQYNVELNGPKFMGFGDFGGYSGTRKELDLRGSLMANIEAGFKLILNNRYSYSYTTHAIYIGLYLDYGLTDLKEDRQGTELLSYNSGAPEDMVTNSLVYSKDQDTSSDYIEKVKILAFGLKLRYGFGF